MSNGATGFMVKEHLLEPKSRSFKKLCSRFLFKMKVIKKLSDEEKKFPGNQLVSNRSNNGNLSSSLELGVSPSNYPFQYSGLECRLWDLQTTMATFTLLNSRSTHLTS